MEPTFIITSPNSQFTEMAQSVSDDLNFKALIIEAVLDEALEKIKAARRGNDVSAIISRGGTAGMLKDALDIPVLVAEANDFDILTALVEASDISPKIAFVLSADYVIEDLSWITERFSIQMRPYPFSNSAELSEAIRKAKRDGCGVVVSGSDRAFQISRQYGLPCVLVNTSRRTMEELVRRAIMIGEVRDREIRHRQLLSSTLNLVPETVFYLDSSDKVQLVNEQGLKLLNLKDESHIIGRPLSEFIGGPDLERITCRREKRSGQVLNIQAPAGIKGRNADSRLPGGGQTGPPPSSERTMLLHSAPVYVQDEYLGLVLSLTPAAEVEKMEHRLRREAHAHASGMVAETTFQDMEAVAASPRMIECLRRARTFAESEGTILITGESGTGKELLAQSIHNASRRRGQAFVAINCAALPLSLLESELFGYEEGAFTGAKRGGKPGYFELAHGGTIFLDELGLLPVNVQMQLLRVLQSRQVLRVGGRKMIPVDVRVVAATNADLESAVADGTFRQDLYYRVNVLHVAIPPLRKRPQDINLLTRHYLPRLNRENNKNIRGLDPALLSAFQGYDWPGNIRELLNYLTRLVVSAPGPELSLTDLKYSGVTLKTSGEAAIGGTTPALSMEKSHHSLGGASPLFEAEKDRPAMVHEEKNDYPFIQDNGFALSSGSLEEMEEQIIRWYMLKNKGLRSAVCEQLGISRTTLWKKLKKMGLEE